MKPPARDLAFRYGRLRRRRDCEVCGPATRRCAGARSPACGHPQPQSTRGWRRDQAPARCPFDRDMLGDEESRRINDELRWAAQQLGDARHLDVYIQDTLGSARTKRPEDHALADCAQQVMARRDRAYDEALAAIRSQRFQSAVAIRLGGLRAGAGSARAAAGHVSGRARSRSLRRPSFRVARKIGIDRGRAWSVIDALVLWAITRQAKSIAALAAEADLPPQIYPKRISRRVSFVIEWATGAFFPTRQIRLMTHTSSTQGWRCGSSRSRAACRRCRTRRTSTAFQISQREVGTSRSPWSTAEPRSCATTSSWSCGSSMVSRRVSRRPQGRTSRVSLPKRQHCRKERRRCP
jgi:hypothetical protein